MTHSHQQHCEFCILSALHLALLKLEATSSLSTPKKGSEQLSGQLGVLLFLSAQSTGMAANDLVLLDPPHPPQLSRVLRRVRMEKELRDA